MGPPKGHALPDDADETQEADIAEEAGVPTEPVQSDDKAASPNFALPAAFAAWLTDSLERELSSSVAEGMLATVEGMLIDVQDAEALTEALSNVREILESQG